MNRNDSSPTSYNHSAQRELVRKRGEALARVYALILSPEWAEEKPAPTLRRHYSNQSIN